MKILVVTGKSGGHIYPALSFLEALEERFKDVEILLVLPAKNVLSDKGLPRRNIAYLSISPVSLKLNKKNLKGFLNLCKGFSESARILSGFKPDLVVGFGSIASLPMVILAWLCRVRIILHEQNVSPCRANRLMAFCADRIAVSFKETLPVFKNYERKTVVTGNPLRKQLSISPQKEALGYLGLGEDKCTILVMGCSQGSHNINAQFMQCVSLAENKSSFQVIHLVGGSDYDVLEKAYKSQGIDFRLFSFLESMQYAYSAADLVVSRAGATTITELIFFKKPAILIPYPYAYRHQLNNARILSERSSAVILEEDSLTALVLKNQIQSLIEDRARLEAMRRGFEGIMPQDAAGLLADLAGEAFKHA
ncbi:MAG: UDP-N-acetylglucosamine--N-acetylmuramyl-(pentapeptide) pyrophosphoryl-undecaprenol N-acetylglucosamine transferase [Candidatus Omnitrophica bacterium]|nr:UDP-N-acetylglucosamine--N-acetylmuramyl-(pentapeptide) pyrophosphoryl-undecaprenol N-acetylglucosamine transferase [Candidatus Omnitrophota bacterium]